MTKGGDSNSPPALTLAGTSRSIGLPPRSWLRASSCGMESPGSKTPCHSVFGFNVALSSMIKTVSVRYFGVSPRFASSCTDFVVADFAIADLVDEPQAAGGFVICLANTRELAPSGRNVDQYPDRLSKGLCWTIIWLNRIFTPHSRLFFGWRMLLAGSLAFSARSVAQLKSQP